MAYVIEGVERETDADGYLLEPDFGAEAVEVIAAAEGIALTDEHRAVIEFMREKYRADGHTPNFRALLKGFADEVRPGTDSKYLYALFPAGPAKQAAKIAGLPQPYGKGGY
jgi:tRNA 2-thiouridine synthesizing protein E